MTSTLPGKEAAPLVTVTIDGVEVEVPKGTLIIRAAESAGIEIPRFCDHPLLKPAGACRQCLVEVGTPDREGNLRMMPKPQASCTMEVTPGMVVNTQHSSPVAEKAQDGIMEFLLINHPLDCPICDKGGECPLQNQAMKHGRDTSRFIDVKRTFPKPIKISTQILLDRDRCILCQRCTRFSSQIAGDAFIALQGRGGGTPGYEVHSLNGSQIGRFDEGVLGFASDDSSTPVLADDLANPFGGPAPTSGYQSGPVGVSELDESGRPFASYFSGNTIQICPVGALTSASYRFRSRPFDLVSTDAVAEHDSSGAAIRVDMRGGEVLRRLSGRDLEVNEEWITDKDRFAFTWPKVGRLTVPQVRDESTGELVNASWSEAFDVAAQGLKKALEAGGVAALPGGRLTLEDAFAWSAFTRRVLGTNDVDYRARAASDEEASFLATYVAGSGMGVTFTDLEFAPQVLCVDFEPEEEAGNVFLRLRKGVIAGRVAVATVAPFLTRGSAKLSAQLLAAAPGTQPEVLSDLDSLAPDVVAGLKQPGAVILVGERAAITPGTLSAVVQLAESTGARLAWIPRRAGERAAIEAGLLPGLLPGGRPVADPAARVDLATVWGADVPSEAGRTLPQILDALRAGELAGAVVGGLELIDLPDPRAAREALAKAFVVQLEVRSSEVSDYADVVLPVAPPVEKPGTFINWEGRLRPFAQVKASSAMPDRRVLHQLAAELGVDLEVYKLADAIAQFQELGTWEERAAFEPVPAAAVPAAGDGQAVLATFKLMLDAGALQDGEPHLAGTAHRAVARLAPAFAQRLGLSDGAEVRVTGPAGSVTLPLAVTEMPDRVVWVPQNSRPCSVYEQLGAVAGELVTIEEVAK